PVTAGFILVMIIGGFALMHSCTSTDPKSERNSLESYQAYSCAQSEVRNMLKSPSTASFISRSSPEYSSRRISSSEVNITSAVDAQNSFGAQIRSTFTCNV